MNTSLNFSNGKENKITKRYYCDNSSEIIPEDYESTDQIYAINDNKLYEIEVSNEKTASGSIASFPDGADDVPVKALSVALEPVQDLHGQSSPYPAGGGVNKLDMATVTTHAPTQFGLAITITDTCVNLSGAWTGSASGAARTVDVPSAVRSYNIKAFESTGHVSARWQSGEDVIVFDFANMTNGSSYNLNVHLVAYEGSTAPTAWSPYANICPITGHAQCEVWRAGVNVWDEEWENGYLGVDGTNVTYIPSSSRIRSKNWIPVVVGKTYYYNGGGYGSFIVGAEDTNGTNAVLITSSDSSGFTFTPTRPFVKFACRAGYGGTYNNNISINYPSTDTDYHAHSIVNISIPLGQTVYGGTVDVVGGKVVVDRAYETITKDSAWYGFATGTGNSSAVVQLAEYQNVLYVDGASSHNGAISSTGLEEANYWVNARQNEMPTAGDMCFAYSATGQLRFHRLDVATITDIASFKANFPDTQVCYKLATPITIDLTDIPELTTLYGTNNIWSDSGDVSVEYRADIQKYITKVIAEAIS